MNQSFFLYNDFKKFSHLEMMYKSASIVSKTSVTVFLFLFFLVQSTELK